MMYWVNERTGNMTTSIEVARQWKAECDPITQYTYNEFIGYVTSEF